MKRLLILSLIFMALVGSASAVFDPADYTYSEDFFVNSTTAQTSFQVKMILSNETNYSAISPWYTNGTTRTDWLDVAWTDTSNNLLPFWKENRTDTAINSTWWINVSSIVNDNTTEIRLHYGDADAAEFYSNGTATFDFFDDFPGSSLEVTTKWTVQGGTPSVSGSILTLNNAYIFGKAAFPSSYVWDMRIKSAHFHSNSFYEQILSDVNPPGAPTYIGAFPSNPTLFGDYSQINSGTPNIQEITGWDADTWLTLQLVDTGTQGIWTANDGNTVTHPTGTTYPSGTTRYMHYVAYDTGSIISLDWVLMRKHTSVEPFLTHNATAEEPAGDPPIASFTCDHTFLRIPQPVTCTDTSTESPTSWNWSFGDGTYSEDENPVHKYTKRGAFDVTLTATNDDGSDESDITEAKVIGYETYT